MSQKMKRLGLLLALGFALLPLCGISAGDKKSADKNQFYVGKVVNLAELLAKEKTILDADTQVLVLQAEDGKLYPLLKDNGSRMFFKDARLLNRPMRLTARKIPNSEFLHSRSDGRHRLPIIRLFALLDFEQLKSSRFLHGLRKLAKILP